MLCPQCEQEMKHKSQNYKYWSTGDDPDYDSFYEVETYKCSNCKISCVINHEAYISETKWNMPIELLPTTKQVKTVKFINNHLGLHEDCPTKKSAWRFINKYFDKAKQAADNDFYGWCEDNQGWLPECF